MQSPQPLGTRISLALILLLFAPGRFEAADAGSERGRSGKVPKLEELIFDRSAFVAALPRKVLVTDRPPNQPAAEPDDAELLAAALAKLGSVEGVEFIRLPAGAALPSVTGTVAPTYPPDMMSIRAEGDATFLVFIRPPGRVSAIYCTGATDPQFAIHAAAAIVRWAFTPAELQHTKVPVLTRITVRFDLRQRTSAAPHLRRLCPTSRLALASSPSPMSLIK